MASSIVGRLFASSLVLGALLGVARVASADEAPPAASAPAPSDDRPCAVERRVGVTDVEAEAVEEVVCGIIRTSPTHQSGRYRVRVTKIGSKLLLTLRAERGARFVDERQLMLASLDEVNIAAPRLLEAAEENKPVAETVTTENVVGDEARTPKKRPAAVHAYMGVLGASAPGQGGGAGVNVGISAGSDEWSFVGDLRLAGNAFNKPAAIFSLGLLGIDTSDDAFSYVSLSGGARHHFSTSDVSPFVGAGLGIDAVAPETKSGSDGSYDRSSDSLTEGRSKVGAAGYVEAGVDVLRTRTIGGLVLVRADLPMFATEKTEPSATDPSRTVTTKSYSPVISAGIALRF